MINSLLTNLAFLIKDFGRGNVNSIKLTNELNGFLLLFNYTFDNIHQSKKGFFRYFLFF